jgi:CMP-N-acetylneuraminic acid synthetase
VRDGKYLHVTSPLLSGKSLKKSIDCYKKKIVEGYDSLASVEEVKKYLWHNEKPVNYNPNKHPRSQDLPGYVALNFAINIISREYMIERKNILGKNFYPFLLNEIESVDVDNELEFKIAELIYSKLMKKRGISEDIR